MPDLRPVLNEYDLGLLQVIAGLWGLELNAPSQREAAEELAAQLLQADRVGPMVQALPAEIRAALDAVARDRMPFATFTRKYGELRAMGPARRDREQPWANAPSPAETLWYRGLIARAFFDVGNGPQEFIFIPDDLRSLIPVTEPASQSPDPPGAPAHLPESTPSNERCHSAPGDVVTLLAYLQINSVKLEAAVFPPGARMALNHFLRQPEALDFCTHLIRQLGLAVVDRRALLKPAPAHTRPFLEAAPAMQTRTLAEAWRESREWNDLLSLPGLVFEGVAWHNDPFTARRAILNLLAEVPPGEWWSLDSFVAAVKERQPDFQRPAGDYDSWYIRDAATQGYLRGFENWERVDAALVRWLIQCPLRWLGLLEVFSVGWKEQERQPDSDSALSARFASPAPAKEIAFRVTPFGAAFLGKGEWPEDGLPAPIQVSAEGTLRVPASASRYDRFQAARVTDWLALEGDEYTYRLTPASLTRAVQRGISISRIVAFLQTAAGEEAVPPSLIGALHRWERAGSEAILKETVALKLQSNELLETLRRTPLVQRYLGESLGLAAVEVRREDVEKLRAALAEVGILVDN